MKATRIFGAGKTSLMILAVLCLCSQSWAGSLTADAMYLNPAAIQSSNYGYDYQSAGYTASFTGVVSLQVLPVLTSDGSGYFFTPEDDYTGDITDEVGSITFLRPGPYFVLATYTDSTTQLFDYGIGFRVNPEATGPTYNWRVIDTPSPDVVMIDPDLASTQPDFPSTTTEVTDKATWAAVTTYLKTLTNKHVELSGHGNKGQFYWKGELVLDDSTQATKDWLESMKGHINYLTFMSCYTGAGTEGTTFLQQVADTLGKSAGYTDVVGGNGTRWFINGEGTLKVVPLPSSAFLGVVGLVALGLLRRKRRRF